MKKTDKVTKVEQLAYALANLGNIPIQVLIGSYLLIFYTNVVGLNPAACATLFLIARVIDGLNDPFVGFVIDHFPTTKHGHFRPILAVGAILCSLNFVLLWYGPLMAPAGKLVIAYISYLLIGVLFPVMDISLNSMLPVMTSKVEERNKLSSLKGVVYMMGNYGIGAAVPILLGDTSNKDGYLMLVAIIAVVVVVFSVLGAAGMKERVASKPGSKKYGIKDLVKILTQKPVMITFLSMLLATVGTYMLNTANTYFFTYIMDNLALLGLASIIQFVALIPASILVTSVIKKFGKKKLYIVGSLMVGLLPIIRLIDITNVPILCIAIALSGVGMGISMPLTYGIQADNTDYIELKLGYRAEGAVASLSSFTTKCAMGIGGAIPGYLLAFAGFDQTAAVQSEAVRNVLTGCVIVGPAILSIIGVAVFSAFYPITKEKLIEQNEILAERRKM